jgi:hypothetical protein
MRSSFLPSTHIGLTYSGYRVQEIFPGRSQQPRLGSLLHHFLATTAAGALIHFAAWICTVSYSDFAAALRVGATVNFALLESHFRLLSLQG